MNWTAEPHWQFYAREIDGPLALKLAALQLRAERAEADGERLAAEVAEAEKQQRSLRSKLWARRIKMPWQNAMFVP